MCEYVGVMCGWGTMWHSLQRCQTPDYLHDWCLNTWHMSVEKDKSASCTPDVDLTSILAIPVLNKPHPWGGRQREDWFNTLGLIFHACLFKPAGAPSVSKSLCHFLSLSVCTTHIFFSHTFLYHWVFTHICTHSYAHRRKKKNIGSHFFLTSFWSF